MKQCRDDYNYSYYVYGTVLKTMLQTHITLCSTRTCTLTQTQAFKRTQLSF